MAAGSKQVMIIGAGATGALSSSFLMESSPNLIVGMWEKGRGGGGRMSTHRTDHTRGHVDMGAQYITRYHSSRDSKSMENIKNKIFGELLRTETLIPFQGTIDGSPQSATPMTTPTTHYVSAAGINAVPKYFLERSKISVKYRTQLESVDIKDQSIVLTSTDGLVEEAESLILTIPVPQCLSIKGNLFKYTPQDVLHNLRGVAYSSRYALGLFFTEPVPKTSWTGKYYDDPIVRYMCWDTNKYSLKGNNEVSSLLVHSSVPFGLKELETDKDRVKDTLLAAAKELIPGLPTPSDSYVIRWRYSQVFKGYVGSPGYAVLSSKPLIVVTGDAFTHSNLEGCIEAAAMTTDYILDNIDT